jgi:hypothetical protein
METLAAMALVATILLKGVTPVIVVLLYAMALASTAYMLRNKGDQ